MKHLKSAVIALLALLAMIAIFTMTLFIPLEPGFILALLLVNLFLGIFLISPFESTPFFKMKSNKTGLYYMALYLPVGLIQFAGSLWTITEAKASENWDLVWAEFSRAGTEYIESQARSGNNRVPSSKKEFKVNYTYEIDSTTYSGKRPYFRWGFNSYFESKRSQALWQSIHSRSRRSKVFVSPKDPRRSTTIAGVQADVGFYPLVGIFHALIGFVAVFALRNSPKTPSKEE